MDDMKEFSLLASPDGQINTIAFSHDGMILASGSENGTIQLWDWEKIITKVNHK